ncbi:YceI family protein [Spongiimicrobium salis]|uniref:YceI family protein n=1 Tax=Spongiimicrobium salis TaxID=1667022 RepID=UPI00374D0373
MQKIISILLFCSTLTMSAQQDKTYTLNTEKSKLHWKGTYSFLFNDHSGFVQFKAGQLRTFNGHISGGSFVIDMHSITDEEYRSDRGPIEHLKDGDFFDVSKFPEASLVITAVKYNEEYKEHEIEAMLTIKKIAKPIAFRAKVDGPKKRFNARFKIDRTRWGIVYNSKLKNEAISDAIEFEATLFF